ncbi:Glyoxalase/bleomycin resistance protein/dioxygenase [Solidesulfovibrio fructosivorans JJ]]|uniref:Glyoxalase/bleomycin resistance protein/dioxygenase n=1 Tax=Solidesulfovibrio fructosivorans JJ] TaxID=596151 RepID=E1JZS1_SOLFR|nr:VOC family protein [Solidesulfovibrio fructosivorans]EFL50101.1 Glyoxalase/bleomycin resistance protein/dioxygenase [Solidesulfovibrio fructosivorans JJ]]
MSTRYVHTNIVARDWRGLASFYIRLFDCRPVPPERDLSGDWLDAATALAGAHITGLHLRLPGHGDTGPTLEIFSYDALGDRLEVNANTPGFAHIAFLVDDVAAKAREMLDAGGSAVGELASREVPGVGKLTFRYMRDPEGNMIEIQSWG